MRRNCYLSADLVKMSLFMNARLTEFKGKTFDQVYELVKKEFPGVAASTVRGVSKEVGIEFAVRRKRNQTGAKDRLRYVARTLAQFLTDFSTGVDPDPDDLEETIRNLRLIARGGTLEKDDAPDDKNDSE